MVVQVREPGVEPNVMDAAAHCQVKDKDAASSISLVPLSSQDCNQGKLSANSNVSKWRLDKEFDSVDSPSETD